MISKNDVINFYKVYRTNLEREHTALNKIFTANNEEELSRYSYEYYGTCLQLYSENELLLNCIVRPFSSSSEELNDELCETFLDEATKLCVDGFIDYAAGISVLTFVDEYYKKHDNLERHLAVIHSLAGFYHRLNSSNTEKKCLDYTNIERKYINSYKDFNNIDAKKRLIFACFNYIAVSLNYIHHYKLLGYKNITEYCQMLLDEIRWTLDTFHNVSEDFAKNDYDLEPLSISIISNVIPVIIEYSNIDMIPSDYITLLNSTVENQYNKELEDIDNEMLISPDLYCSYWSCRYYDGEITLDSLIEKYDTFATNLYNTEPFTCSGDYEESRSFSFAISCLPKFVKYIATADKKKNSTLLNKYITLFINITDKLPTFTKYSLTKQLLSRDVIYMLPYLPENISAFYFIFRTLIVKNEFLLFNSSFVRKSATYIANALFDCKPECFIGLFETHSTIEVAKKRDEIINYIEKASLMYDIGLLELSSLTGIKGRSLTQEENDIIREHIYTGTSYTDNCDELSIYHDIVIGHHKSYNGKSGYPAEFDNTKSPYRIVIDIIHLCDYLINLNPSSDAKTDELGSLLDEFIEDCRLKSGTEFNPDIVNVLINNENLRQELHTLLVNNRSTIFYQIFERYIKDSAISINSGKNRELKVVNAISNISFGIYDIDLKHDKIYNLAIGNNHILPDVESSSFSDFINNSLKAIVHPDDIQTFDTLVNYGLLYEKLYLNNGNIKMCLRCMIDNTWKWLNFVIVTADEDFRMPEEILLFIFDADEDTKNRLMLTENLAIAKEQATNAALVKSAFLSNISHEIRTPMNVVIGMTELMDREELNRQQEEYLKHIKDSSNVMLSIIDELLDFSKLESGDFKINEEQYDTLSMLNDLSLIYINKIGDCPVELYYDIDPKLPKKLYGDCSRVKQIFNNLVFNAIKYTQNGHISISVKIASIEDDDIVLECSISDTGIGIPKEKLAELLEPFKSFNDSYIHHQQGIGFGLIICKKLIELMNGTFKISSTPGIGSIFTFTIHQKMLSGEPAITLNNISSELIIAGIFADSIEEKILINLCSHYNIKYINFDVCRLNRIQPNFIFVDSILYKKAELAKTLSEYTDSEICVLQNPIFDEIANTGITLVSKPLYTLSFCGTLNHDKAKSKTIKDNYINFTAPEAKILIVDDSEMNIKVALGLMKPFKLNISTAINGEEAVSMIKSCHYDLVFMDHQMPVMDGITATKIIRSLSGHYYSSLPIIALSANAFLEAREKFILAGMNDFIPKPVEMKDIYSKLIKWLPKELIHFDANSALIVKDNEDDKLIIPSLTGINITDGIHYSGSKKLFLELLNDFYKLIDYKTEKLNTLIEDNNIKDYTIEVHALKNTARMIGASKLSEFFYQMELYGNQNNISAIKEHHSELINDFNAYKDYLSPLINNDELLPMLSIKDTEELLDTMYQDVEWFDLDGVDNALKKLVSHKIPSSIQSLVSRLEAAVADVAMEDIQNIITKIKDKLGD